MCQKDLIKEGDTMTRKEIVKLIQKQEKEGNEQVISLVKLINLYLPRFLEYPEAATRSDIDRYNSLVRSNIDEPRLLEKLIVRR